MAENFLYFTLTHIFFKINQKFQADLNLSRREEGTMMLERMIRAALLDVNLYEEVEADEGATSQAFWVIIIVSMAGGIGLTLAGLSTKGVLPTLFLGSLGALLSWLIWAALTYLIGTTILRGPETSATYGELLRTLGFSASPGILRIFVFIPLLGRLIASLAYIWMLVTMVIAVRQALDFSTGRAIATCIIGWLIQMLLLGITVNLLR